MEDVRQYLQMLQDIINRMAANSANCKTWAISLFTAMTALIISVQEIRQWVWFICVPIGLFYLLDAYYLGLENDFRNLEDTFIKQLRSSADSSSCVYDFNFKNAGGYKKWKNLKKGLMSNATWPMYLALTAISFILIIVFANSPKENKKEQDDPIRQLVIKHVQLDSIPEVKPQSKAVEQKQKGKGL